MHKEVISDKQGISIISLFIIGSSIVLTTAGDAKKDLWIAIILSLIASIPIVLIHARLLIIFPKKDLYDVLELVFGKFIGKVISVIFIWFSFFLSGLVLRVFGDFIYVSALSETPQIVIMVLIAILCIWAVKEGIETIGRWGEFFFPGTIAFILIFNLLLIPKMDINNLRPTLYEGIKPIIDGAFHAFMFPFTQTIVFTTFLSSLKKKSVYKVYIVGLLIGGVVLYISSITDVLVLGSKTVGKMYFPTYETAMLLRIKDIAASFEVLITSVFIVGGFIKVCMCLLSTCNGAAKLLGFNDYRFMVTPIGFLIINLSYVIHDSVMEKAEFASDIYPYYAFPFQVVLPIIIWIFAEIKKKKLVS